jgi:trigger factor
MEVKEQQALPQFSNDQVKFTVHRKPASRVEFEVEASTSLVKAAQETAIKRVGKEVTLPGFRKGKAPDGLVLKNYSKQIDKDWQECIASSAFRECQKLANVPTLSGEPKISFKMQSHSLDGAKLVLEFETEPTVPTINPKELQLKSIERPEVNEEKVKETIRQLLLFFAEWTKISERPVKEGDFVLLDVDVVETDPPTKLFTNVRFEVTDHSMAKWMKDLVLDKNKDDVLEGVSVPDQNASVKDKEELQPRKVRVVIKEIEEAKVPPLDDTFAKGVGAASVSEMTKSVEKLLNKKADEHVQEKLREQLSDVLLTKYPFDIPISLIDRETRFRMQQLLKDDDYAKYWNSMTTEARKRTVGSIAEQSEKAVRMFYLCRKILNDAGIKVTANDIPNAPSTPLDLLLGEGREINPQEKTEVHQAEAFSRLLLEKAEDYLISNAVIHN